MRRYLWCVCRGCRVDLLCSLSHDRADRARETAGGGGRRGEGREGGGGGERVRKMRFRVWDSALTDENPVWQSPTLSCPPAVTLQCPQAQLNRDQSDTDHRVTLLKTPAQFCEPGHSPCQGRPPLLHTRPLSLLYEPVTVDKMKPFTYNALPARVVFGWGTSAQVKDELQRLGCVRVSLLLPSCAVTVES